MSSKSYKKSRDSDSDSSSSSSDSDDDDKTANAKLAKRKQRNQKRQLISNQENLHAAERLREAEERKNQLRKRMKFETIKLAKSMNPNKEPLIMLAAQSRHSIIKKRDAKTAKSRFTAPTNLIDLGKKQNETPTLSWWKSQDWSHTKSNKGNKGGRKRSTHKKRR